jgi:hypothetical protein
MNADVQASSMLDRDAFGRVASDELNGIRLSVQNGGILIISVPDEITWGGWKGAKFETKATLGKNGV